MISACRQLYQTMRSFPEVKWVFFCCCFVHFCPFGQSKLRQFAIVWLHIQSSCMWHWVHNTPQPKHTSTPPLWHNVNIPLAVFQVLLAQRENLLNSGQIFDRRLRVGPRLDDHLFFTAGFGSGYLKKKKKYKTVVFIATVALSYARWPCWFNYEKAAGQSKRKKQC